MTSGVYALNVGPYFYIGSSMRIEQRHKVHLGQLKKAVHRNGALQEAWNEYQDCVLVVLKPCHPYGLTHFEQEWLDVMFDDEHCVNLRPNATTSWGFHLRSGDRLAAKLANA